MDSLVEEYSAALNGFKFDHHLTSIHPENRYRMNHEYMDFPGCSIGSTFVAQSIPEGDDCEEVDYSDAMLKYVGQMLMEEEDLGHKPCMFYDCMALQATEKYFSDALNDPKSFRSFAIDENLKKPDDGFSQTCSSQNSESSSGVNSWISNQGEFECSPVQVATHIGDAHESTLPSNVLAGAVNGRANSLVIPHQGQDLFNTGHFEFKPRERKQIGHSFPNDDVLMYEPETKETISLVGVRAEDRVKNHSPNDSTGKRHDREDSDSAEDIRSNKLLASSANEFDLHVGGEEELVLCSSPKGLSDKTMEKLQKTERSKRRRPRGGKSQVIIKEVVDLRSLLAQCAQAVANYDNRTANELLKRIKQYSSPSGDATERLAHYLNNALEARLAGTGTTLYASFDLKRISTAEILKAYQVYITACPFKRMSNIFANKCIKKVASGATRLHIIDFGILYGFQWPCLIQALSERPGGPPKLRITGIDFPQPGFRPADRVEETGRRLAKYCKKFNVPFEYNAIAKKWDTIQLEDLQIDGGEVLAVNCLYRLKNVHDETVLTSSPRDVVLNLIKRIKPDIFVHGVTNGTFNSPFFVTRFREALFHFSALFDMFEATVPREDQDRMLFEKEIFGRDVMNVIACEGTERVERPETYKQWQVRNLRAGLRQLPLDREIVNYVKEKVKKCYHKDFIVDEDGNWMLQGWKGKVIYSLSCWKSDKKRQ